MTTETVKIWLSFILVGGFSAVAFLTVGLVVFGYLQSKDGVEILKTFSSIFSGFVGLVVGNYFTKK
jgi:hypothetical protein